MGVQVLGTHTYLDPTLLLHTPGHLAPPAQPMEPRLRAVRSPGGHGIALWLKDAVLARHGDAPDVLCSDPQIGPNDGDSNAPAQRARLGMDLELAESR